MNDNVNKLAAITIIFDNDNSPSICATADITPEMILSASKAIIDMGTGTGMADKMLNIAQDDILKEDVNMSDSEKSGKVTLEQVKARLKEVRAEIERQRKEEREAEEARRAEAQRKAARKKNINPHNTADVEIEVLSRDEDYDAAVEFFKDLLGW